MARGQRRRGSGSGGRRSRPATNRQFPRTARLNALLTEIIGDHFERVDDEDLGFLTITGAEVDADLNVCQVYVSTLAEPDPVEDRRVLDALAEHRIGVKKAIASQAKLRKTPEVVFDFDPAVRSGARIDSILAELDLGDEGGAELDLGDEGGAELDLGDEEDEGTRPD